MNSDQYVLSRYFSNLFLSGPRAAFTTITSSNLSKLIVCTIIIGWYPALSPLELFIFINHYGIVNNSNLVRPLNNLAFLFANICFMSICVAPATYIPANVPFWIPFPPSQYWSLPFSLSPYPLPLMEIFHWIASIQSRSPVISSNDISWSNTSNSGLISSMLRGEPLTTSSSSCIAAYVIEKS